MSKEKLKTYQCIGSVVGGKYLGEVQAKSPEEAIEKAYRDLDSYVSLCHKCSGECENAEIQEIILECDGEDATPKCLCTWTPKEKMRGYWTPGCKGGLFSFWGSKINAMTFCPYCGREIEKTDRVEALKDK